MPKKAQLPPGAAGRSQQTLARRNRRDALGKWLRRYAGVAAVAVLAWAAKTAWPRARRKLFPRKPSRRASRAKTAAAIETTAEAAAEWAVVLSLIHISEPTRLGMISYAVFCLKKKKVYKGG